MVSSLAYFLNTQHLVFEIPYQLTSPLIYAGDGSPGSDINSWRLSLDNNPCSSRNERERERERERENENENEKVNRRGDRGEEKRRRR